MMKKLLPTLIAIALVVGAVFLARTMIKNKPKPRQRPGKVVKTVFTDTVLNAAVPIIITANGNLVAKNRIELYAEVQGVLMDTGRDFKPGTVYRRGAVLVNINSDEFYANLQAQKSSFFNTLTAVMPDLRLDFPEEFDKWQAYLEQYSMEKPLEELPGTKTDKERFFIAGRGILTAYYNVHNMEVKLSKYQLRAPFTGILTEATVNPGTLVRPGQKLGELIDPSLFEMAVSVKSEYRDLLEIGKTVKLYDLEGTGSWTGEVVRINGKVDTDTQTVQAYIEVSDDSLREGQYLEIALEAKTETNAIEVPRSLLVRNTMMYVVRDTVLDLVEIEPVFENKNTVVVKGLTDGATYLSRPVPGAYSGMRVKVFTGNQETQ
jgi:multidrug efflux pump subunit AcrA (membrane-fusion protein)